MQQKRQWQVDGNKCDRIGDFLKLLVDKFSYKIFLHLVSELSDFLKNYFFWNVVDVNRFIWLGLLNVKASLILKLIIIQDKYLYSKVQLKLQLGYNIFFTKVPQIFSDFLSQLKNITFIYLIMSVANIFWGKCGKTWATFGKSWATFHINIWSHWREKTNTSSLPSSCNDSNFYFLLVPTYLLASYSFPLRLWETKNRLPWGWGLVVSSSSLRRGHLRERERVYNFFHALGTSVNVCVTENLHCLWKKRYRDRRIHKATETKSCSKP